MSRSPAQTDSLDLSPYDEVIDVRSPAEFAEDHIPGAINLPVLDDGERAEIGTMYKQDSAFRAKKAGAARVSRNIARHLESHFADKPGEYAPLVHCWRGGQRSGSMAIVLARIGWQVTTLQGGYKRYRTNVIDRLYETEPWFTFRVVAGLTGTAKTRILAALRAAGEQVLDLEGLANHKGSLLGADPASPQPGQKMFESRILGALDQMDPGRRIWVESESSKIGQRHCPPVIWKGLQSGAAIEVSAPVNARVDHIKRDYAHFFEDPDSLADLLGKLRQAHGNARIDEWIELLHTGDWNALVARLLEEHYDPAYRRSMDASGRTVATRHAVPDLSDETLSALAAELSNAN